MEKEKNKIMELNNCYLAYRYFIPKDSKDGKEFSYIVLVVPDLKKEISIKLSKLERDYLGITDNNE